MEIKKIFRRRKQILNELTEMLAARATEVSNDKVCILKKKREKKA